MPRQDRPVVRGGRLQVKKKRTDRSYLSPSAPSPAEPQITEEPVAEEATPAEITAPADPTAAFAPPPPPPSAVPAPSATMAGSARTSGAARALQQQGVRKRSDVDLQALARRDTSYALHELRRIGVLAVMVVVTLIVLGVVMR